METTRQQIRKICIENEAIRACELKQKQAIRDTLSSIGTYTRVDELAFIQKGNHLIDKMTKGTDVREL